MAGFGPPPKPGRRRRNAPLGGLARIRLPANGRQGPPPQWPLSVPQDNVTRAAEMAEWRRLWRKPQAVAWEQLDTVEVVARYCRLVVDANRGAMGAYVLMPELRQLEFVLGLNPMAMLRLGWTVEEGEVDTSGRDKKVIDIRARLKAVDAK